LNSGRGLVQNLCCTLNPLNYLRAARFINAAEPDVVCFPLGHAWNAGIAALLGKVPQVYILHDPQRHLGESSRIYTALERWHLKRVRRVIVLSRAFQILPEGSPDLPVDVVPHGEFGAFEPYVAPPMRNKLLFLGRFRRYKALPLLLEGFRQARRRLPQLELTIAGSGSLNLGPFPPGVTLISKWLADAEMRELCETHDVVVAPYVEATQSGVVALAQSLGRAVIVTDVGGLPEQITPEVTGLVVEFGARALAGAIVRIFTDLDCASMGRAGKELYQTQFNWDRLAGLAARSFEKAMGGRGKG
jgi:glycosyltransferase involved in cell wall biosynthesis